MSEQNLSKEASYLIKKFKLEKHLHNARISFFYGSNPRMYLIAFNSERRNQVLVKPMIKHLLNVGWMQGGKVLENFSPPVDLTMFSGNIHGNIMFLVVDFAYLQMGGIKFLESVEDRKAVKFYYL